MKKQPRIYSRKGRFHCAIWVESKQDFLKRSTGIELDIIAPEKISDNPEWWKASKHAKGIESFIEQMQYARATALRGVVETPKPSIVTFESLLNEYNKVSDRLSGIKSPKTYERRALAIRLYLKYFKHVSISAVTQNEALEFRTQMQLDKYASHTILGYVKSLRALFKFAVKRKYITINPFEGITVKVRKKKPKRITIEEEYRLYRFMWEQKRPLFFQILFERITGFRAQDVCDFETSYLDLQHQVIDYDNQKGTRHEEYPYSSAIQLLISMMPTSSPYRFKYRDRRTVHGYLVKAAKWAGVQHVTVHDLKRFYSQEISPHCPDERTFTYLMHHLPAGATKTAVEYYLGRDLRVGRQALDNAQKHWIDFLVSLKDIPEINDFNTYVWGNRKRKIEYQE